MMRSAAGGMITHPDEVAAMFVAADQATSA